MVKKLSLCLCLLLFISCFSVSENTTASSSTFENTQFNSESTIDGYITQETISQKSLDTQIKEIQNELLVLGSNINKLDVLSRQEVQSLYNELSNINLDSAIKVEMGIFQEQAFQSAIKSNDQILENLSIMSNINTESQPIITEVIVGEDILETEYDYEIGDTPPPELIDANVSLNIITGQSIGNEREVMDIESYNQQIRNQINNGGVTTDPVNPAVSKILIEGIKDFFQPTSVMASSGIGWFITADTTYSINQQTDNAKFYTQVVVVSAGGQIKPVSYNINLTHHSASSRNGSFLLERSNVFNNVKIREIKNITSSITKTRFWKGASSTTGIFPNGQVKTEKFSSTLLLNKKGVPYPNYTDPYSKKVMIEPTSTTWDKGYGEAWTDTKRQAYRKWYDSSYRVLLWKDWEIHHIRPRLYNGSSEYSNLMPLVISFHKQTVSPWWTNY